MTLPEAEKLVMEKLKQFNLNDWKFEWIARRKKFSLAGQCRWKKKIIRLQPTFVELNSDEDVLDTILHEIAHALRPNHGHNKFCKKTAAEIGCKPTRCYGSHIIRSKQ